MFFLSCIIPQPLFPSRFYNMQMNQPHQENTEQVTNKKIPLEPGASEINDLLPKTAPKQRENRQIPTTKQPENHYKTYKNQINKKDDKKKQNYSTNDRNFYYTQEPFVNSSHTQPGHTYQPTQKTCLTTQEFKNSIIQMKQVIEDILVKTITEDIKKEETELQEKEKKYEKHKSKKNKLPKHNTK